MSVASDIVPEVFIPDRARPVGAPAVRSRLRCVTGTAAPLTVAPTAHVADEDFIVDLLPVRPVAVRQLHRPSSPAAAAPVRLTALGRIALGALVAAVSLTFVALAARSAPSAGAARPGPSVLTVRPGDTLWSIATAVAPDRDPRAEVDYLRRRNHLSDVDLAPGQVLRVR